MLLTEIERKFIESFKANISILKRERQTLQENDLKG